MQNNIVQSFIKELSNYLENINEKRRKWIGQAGYK